MKGTLEVAQQIPAFSQARDQADTDRWKAPKARRKPGDLSKRQRKFTKKAAAQYLDKANKRTTRMFAVIRNTTTPFGERMTKPHASPAEAGAERPGYGGRGRQLSSWPPAGTVIYEDEPSIVDKDPEWVP